MEEEVAKLLNNGFVREVKYLDWLANIVVHPKKNGKRKVCVNYKDLNKVYLKDSFPVPNIDQLIDSTAGHDLLSFLVPFPSNNQIYMDTKDQEKISFITYRGTYCYNAMPFELKNTGAACQRLVTQIFVHHIGEPMKVYIDNMLVKLVQEDDRLDHLQEVFAILRKYSTKMNQRNAPSKWAQLSFLVV